MTTIDETVKKIKRDLALTSQWHDRNTMDILLKRDLFVEESDIDELLDSADPDAWEWVYVNRERYSTRIRMLIEPDNYRAPLEKLKFRLVDLTDSTMEKIELERKMKADEEFDKDWIEHSKTIQDRALSDIDSDLDDAWEKFCKAKEVYIRHLERPTSKKYIAPSSRGNTDSRADELKEDIVVAENEYDLAQKIVEEADEFYWTIKRSEYRKTWMPSM